MKTVMVPTDAGPLTFRKPDDATAMQLLRALFRVALASESQGAHTAFWVQLAPLCLSLPNRRALAARLDGEPALLRQVIEVITGLPPGALGR